MIYVDSILVSKFIYYKIEIVEYKNVCCITAIFDCFKYVIGLCYRSIFILIDKDALKKVHVLQ